MAKTSKVKAEATLTAAKQRRGQVQDRVVAGLRHGLMVGAFIPGQVMSLRKLAAAFGTSSMPVRDAVNQLVAANALEELPNRSVRVPRLGRRRLKDLFAVRERVEGLAANRACRNVSPRLVGDLRTINRELKAAIRRRDILASLAANQRFHFVLYAAADSEVLMPVIESLWLQCGPTMYFSFLAPGMPWDASAHEDLLASLVAKKPVTAERAIRRDIRTTGRHLVANAEFGLPGGSKVTALADLDLDLPIAKAGG